MIIAGLCGIAIGVVLMTVGIRVGIRIEQQRMTRETKRTVHSDEQAVSGEESDEDKRVQDSAW